MSESECRVIKYNYTSKRPDVELILTKTVYSDEFKYYNDYSNCRGFYLHINKIIINLFNFSIYKDEDYLISQIIETIEHEYLHYIFRKFNLETENNYVEEFLILLLSTVNILDDVNNKEFNKYLIKNIKEDVYKRWRKYYGDINE